METDGKHTAMNYDHVSLAGVVLSAALLYGTANLLWFIPLFVSAIYGGWRLGYRLIPPESV